MHIDEFEDVLNEFSSVFDCIKLLCGKLRGILFSYKNDLFIETSSNSFEELYRSNIEAFDSAIVDIAAR